MLKLDIIITRPRNKTIKKAMINTRAEANVILIRLIKMLGNLILRTQNLKIKTVSRQIVQFSRIAKVTIKIRHSIRYKTIFFLVTHVILILLEQLFISKIKIALNYLKDKFINAMFINLDI